MQKTFGQKLTKNFKKYWSKNVKSMRDNENSLTLAINAFKKLIKKNHKINFKNLIFVTENNLRKFPGNSFFVCIKFRIK